MSDDFSFHVLKDAAQYANRATAFITQSLREALRLRGKATLLVSGGSSPKPVYECLNQENLDWENITLSLIDERWVPEGADGSNATFIKDTLMQGKASAAKFISLVNDAPTAKQGTTERNTVFKRHFSDPIDVCVMGMGTDGHTASWFPGSPTLSTALDIDQEQPLVWQDATGQAGGSGFADRITVTLPMVMRACHTCLLIPGNAKHKVWKASATKDVHDAPVTSLRAAGERLHVFTHEGG